MTTIRDARPGDPDDVAALAALEDACFGVDAWSAAHVADEVAAPLRRVLVADDAGADAGAAGWAVLGWGAHPDDVADLHRIAVAPGRRRHGTGRLLLETALASAHEAAASAVLLEVSAENAPACAFYATAGFVEIDRRRRYYRDDSDALVLRLELTAR